MNNKNYRALFSVTKLKATEQPPGSILICPNNPTWNDFGFQVRATLIVKPSDDRTSLTLGAFVLPLESGKGSPVARSLSTWIPSQIPSENASLFQAPENAELAFVTLLSDDGAYRDLAGWCTSLEDRLAVLFAINDINLARVQQTIPREEVKRITSTEAFTLGVMRSSSAYRAYSKGARYITRKVPPWIDDSRQDFKVSVQLNGFDEPHITAFGFSASPRLVSDRIHVLIGKNGTGKSQLLNQIIGSLALKADDSESEVFLDKINASFKVDAVSDLRLPNAVLVFSADEEGPFPTKARLDTPLDYSYFCLSAKSVPRSTDLEEKLPLGRALRDLIRDDTKLIDKTRFEIFLEVVNPVLRISHLHLPIKKNNKKVIGTIVDSAGRSWLPLSSVPSSEQQLLHLAAAIETDRDLGLVDKEGHEFPPSSGQRVYLRFAAQALSVISQGSLIVLDEPETHLHPNFISEFMTLLHQVLVATNSIAIVATHSPYVVREVPTSCVHLVTRKGNTPLVSEVHLRTLGASVSSISDAIFGDPSANRFHSLIARDLAKTAREYSGTEDKRLAWLVKTYGHELNTEMLSTVRFLLQTKDKNNDETDTQENQNASN